MQNWLHGSARKNPRKFRYFSRKKPCIHKVHGFACKSPYFITLTTPVPARPEPVHAPALKPPYKAGRRGGESIARHVIFNLIFYKDHPTLVSKEIEMEPHF
ncbi:hypothetical protein FD808_26820 [Klebsiella quasipneumoniae]|nr:hypothetical protein [Klebsiella quasipneumoniae]